MEAINAITREPYTGKNQKILAMHSANYPSAEYLTFKQALTIGRCVRKGEHGVRIVKIVESKTETDGTGRVRKGPRGYTVFNIAQTDALPNAENVAS
ncbi:MAG TPA: ArdC-like ssDNA-binding domain-containing protein [Candidatus Rubrimentiphilum sp.]|nr:ArdC-like ssDNA-binding domain-containing protein [Candidatus Rubrimentiphilum sp.]